MKYLWIALFLFACSEEELDISGSDGTPEVREILLRRPPSDGPSQELLGPRRATLRDAIRQIEHVAEADGAKGLFLQVGPMGGRWGRVADLGEAIGRVREAGKPVHCHFEIADNTAYALMASSCDRISMTPAGTLNLVGVAAQVFYARNLLERVGGEADLLHMGRYKGAGDFLTRTEMPQEARESLDALLDDFDAQLVAAVGQRDVNAREVIEAGPHHAEAARRLGLVDDVGFDDEAREHARQAGSVDKVRTIPLVATAEEVDLSDVLAALSGDEGEETHAEDRLALVHLEGSIRDGETQRPGDATSGPFVAAMRRLADDDHVKAIVLRIDSPGGSALASDRMWHAVRRASSRKPVIASIGDVAASGGYYVASAATHILAHDASIVGSIGVIGGKVSFGSLADELGVNAVTLRRGQNAAWGSGLTAFTDSERVAVEELLRNTYWRFIRRVATGRDMERSAVLAAAEGRVMSGRMGRELGLIDEVGGLGEALRRARSEGGLSDDASVELWPKRQGLLESLTGGSQVRAEELAWIDMVRSLGPVGEAIVQTPMLLADEPVAVGLPFVLVLE
ncbi:MAG: signal peptide peptidase SppA [Myxococcota bacterium]